MMKTFEVAYHDNFNIEVYGTAPCVSVVTVDAKSVDDAIRKVSRNPSYGRMTVVGVRQVDPPNPANDSGVGA